MNTKLIRDWFVYRLLESDFGNVNAGTLADFTVIAPNVEKPKGKRVECSVVFVARKSFTLKGTDFSERGVYMVKLVDSIGTSTADIYGLADKIASRLSPGPLHVVTDDQNNRVGQIQITEPPDIRPMYTVESEIHLPVMIDYNATR